MIPEPRTYHRDEEALEVAIAMSRAEVGQKEHDGGNAVFIVLREVTYDCYVRGVGKGKQ